MQNKAMTWTNQKLVQAHVQGEREDKAAERVVKPRKRNPGKEANATKPATTNRQSIKAVKRVIQQARTRQRERGRLEASPST